ncbi:hypothetical protein TPHA_0D02480 [Tetrapisispora phaffii CBS 4417]|uniref:Phosphatidylinositol N-acetylglucosaminyltransferase subunit GPI19 n=1 Tax=Tetrapisispora phaffii (strain ATCC 24235 / CBS 4417 / NBRC 1672 / NRRL Y-8282 / UCD 70-5) TaxID=1071381 RepID=G8BSR4_TETPH|nr:hypothetical protein TPHA_0D02480 [Tetrapisispora phaffii CBS 4417]CCE62885.1 hypothetical protein TPHA_0D02480 [Tetrapisispora phaffii CBS 4417]
MIQGSFSNEYYWFSRHFITCSATIFIIIWTFIPEDIDILFIKKDFIRSILDILPDRRWVIYFQCFVLMGMLWCYTALMMYNEDVLTPNLDDLSTITDSRANVVIVSDKEKFLNEYAYNATSGVFDLPITDVCKILYSDD